ncbi:MAG: T9SS type A sorting domain-containing protein [Flavobacteriales bacterium]
MSQTIAQTFQLERSEQFYMTGNGVDEINMTYGGKILANKQGNRILTPIATRVGVDEFIGFMSHNIFDLSQQNVQLNISQIAPYIEPYPQIKAINLYGDENLSWISFLRSAPDSNCNNPWAHAPALMKVAEDEFSINDLGLNANCMINSPVSNFARINDTLYCGAFTYRPNTFLYFMDDQGSIVSTQVIDEHFEQFCFVNLPSGELNFIGLKLEQNQRSFKAFNVELNNVTLINAEINSQIRFSEINGAIVVDDNIIIWSRDYILKTSSNDYEIAFLLQDIFSGIPDREVLAVLPSEHGLSVIYSIRQQVSKNAYRDLIDLQTNATIVKDTLISKPLHFSNNPFYFISNNMFSTIGDKYFLLSQTVYHQSSDIHSTLSLFDSDFNNIARANFTRAELSPITDVYLYLVEIPDDTSIIAYSANNHAYQMDKFKVNLLPSHTAQIKYQNNFTLYPNPATSTLNITSEDNVLRQYQITDLQGRKMQSASLPAQAATHEIDIGQLAAGVYLLRVESEKGAVVKRFVKD